MNAVDFVALIGLVFGLAFAQTMKVGIGGPIGRTGSLLLLPGFAMVIYSLSMSFGWWTAALFFGASIAVGIIHGIGMRRHSFAFLAGMQPIYSIVFASASAACAFLLFVF